MNFAGPSAVTVLTGVILLLFVLQGLLMVVDEVVFHRARGLPRWEAVGHPVDSLVYALALMWPAYLPHNGWAQVGYFITAAVSTLTITKDEWVHARTCRPGEHWIHSLLFILHPTIFVAVYLLWRANTNVLVLQALPVPVLLFMVYQIWFWNLRGHTYDHTQSPKSQ